MRTNPRIARWRPVRLATEAVQQSGDPGTDACSLKHWRRISYTAAALSLGAGLLHVWAMPQHYAEWWGYGAFFLVVAVAQVLLSDGLLYRPRRRLLLAGVVGNLAVITLYIVTRTSGIPYFGPHAGDVEEVGGIDLAATIVETMLVIGLVALSRISSPFEPSRMRQACPPGGVPEVDIER